MSLSIPDRWTFTLLPHPPRRTRTRGLGFWNGRPTGTAEGQRGGETKSVIWEPDGPKEFAVPGMKIAHLTSGTFEGEATGTGEVKGDTHAMVFKETATGIQAVDLHTRDYWRTFAIGTAGGRQAGYGRLQGKGYSTPLTWNGTSASITNLPVLEAWKDCEVRGLGDGMIVGRASGPALAHACLWIGERFIDLHPRELDMSECLAASAGDQVGTGWLDLERTVPVLWHGSAESAVVLTPKGMHGGSATTSADGLQAGWSCTDKEQKMRHAVLWAGDPASCIDLHAFVPAGPFNLSAIHALRIHDRTVTAIGNVEQFVDGTYPLCRAALWSATLT